MNMNILLVEAIYYMIKIIYVYADHRTKYYDIIQFFFFRLYNFQYCKRTVRCIYEYIQSNA